MTNYTDFDVKFPSTNGQIIVYEKGGYLYKLDPKTRQSTQINITLTSDFIYGRTELRNVADNITAASLSADGKRLAITARGEVFDVPGKQGVVKNITRTPGANDRGAQISPDGKYIAYISDKTGETEVWLQDEQGGGKYHAVGLGGEKANSNIEMYISKDFLILFLIVFSAFSPNVLFWKNFKYAEKLKN